MAAMLPRRGHRGHRGHAAATANPKTKPRRRPHRALAWALVVATLVLCLAATPRARVKSTQRILMKRNGDGGQPGEPHHGAGALLGIPYDAIWEECPPALRPLFVTCLLVIIVFLFCTISITASDFFCPNLATVAAYLGLSETTAGVTLLAFGNGSPDVFSTFVSVRQGTFGLAVGELIGAASFITSIVVGSIAMVRPFHVPGFAFLRDIFFFTIAVLLLMLVLADGELTLRESGGMVAVYALYVGVVVAQSWWSTRQRKREAYADLGWKVHDEEAAADTNGVEVEVPASMSESLNLSPATPDLGRRRHSSASRMVSYDDAVAAEEQAADTQRAAWSLLGAVEFRDAVNALKREGHTPSSSVGNSQPASPIVPHGDDSDYFAAVAGRHRRVASGPQVRKSSSGRSRSSSLVANWLSRARSTTELNDSFGMPVHASPGLLETVPASPQSAATPTDGDVHPAHDAESHPLAPLNLNIANLRAPDDEPLSSAASRGDVPSISVVDPEGDLAPPNMPLSRTNTTATLVDTMNHTLHRVLHTLFPSLQGFMSKSLFGMVLAVFSVPALFVLTVTLPVVDDGRGDEGAIALPGGEDETLGEVVQTASPAPYDPPSPRSASPIPRPASPRGMSPRNSGFYISSHHSMHATSPRASFSPRDSFRDRPVGPEVGEELHHLIESGFTFNPRHMPDSSALVRAGISCPPSDDGQDDEECVLEFSPALTAAQCICGPVVCVWLLFQEDHFVWWALLGAAAIGTAAAVLVSRLADDGSAQPWRLVRCCAGFVCSMVWIATIADEVVAVLQTFGEIFGLSDAIIGLTIFAVGNSLADLVANVTIAQFAPNMAFSACFGGPMLNLLLGIGGSGTWSILWSQRHRPVTVDFSPTLWVSGTGLMLILATTALFVPLNSFFIDRRWAICLLIGYALLMTVNVVVEIRSERRA